MLLLPMGPGMGRFLPSSSDCSLQGHRLCSNQVVSATWRSVTHSKQFQVRRSFCALLVGQGTKLKVLSQGRSFSAKFSPRNGFRHTTKETTGLQARPDADKLTMDDSLSSSNSASTDLAKYAEGIEIPYASQDAQEIASLISLLEDATAKKKRAYNVKKTRYSVAGSRDGLAVLSWRFHDWDYKKHALPTYARGLFTVQGKPEIAIRGYDKFFNTTEVPDTNWSNIKEKTKGPYELTLKENGCIIFISGLEDGTLLVCSKHSTGDRAVADVSHATAGTRRLEQQLQRIGRTKEDLARELRQRNVTAVAELCDDSFEEHILAYGPEKAGLYLHGININIPRFMTYPSPHVQKFAEDWGFIKTGLILMDNLDQVKTFLDAVAETGAHGGRDVEGFVIRCKKTENGKDYHDWFFKYKFEEPYLLFRQWRECTKALIAGKPPKFKKHVKITEEYLSFAKKRLASDVNLGKLYQKNHGIISLRNDFLAFKNMKGSEAANLEELHPGGTTEVSKDVILVPIATIGCGKTTIGLALSGLFGWGHVQNDNITGSKRPPRFTKALIDELADHPAVVADRNNASKHERKQLIDDVRTQHFGATLVALHFVHDDVNRVREVCHKRVSERGDNHQTIQAATDMNKVRGIMAGFIQRFEPYDPEREPDSGFDAVIDLNPAVGSRTNLLTVVNELHRLYPGLVPKLPSLEEMDAAMTFALQGYKPSLRHNIPERGGKNKQNRSQQSTLTQQPKTKKNLEYMAVHVAAEHVLSALERTFAAAGSEKGEFFKQLQDVGRVKPRFHITLMHRASAKEHAELWQRYTALCNEKCTTPPDGKVGEMEIMLERVVFDDRVMAIVVRLVPSAEDIKKDGGNAEPGKPKWECVNRVSHITVGTRNDSVKPKESNDLLLRWLEKGPGSESGIEDLPIEGRPLLKGVVKGVLSSR